MVSLSYKRMNRRQEAILKITAQLHKELLVTIFVFHHCRTRISTWSVNHELPEFMEIGWCGWFWVGQFPRKNGRNTDFVGLNVDIRRNDGAGGVVDSFTLQADAKR